MEHANICISERERIVGAGAKTHVNIDTTARRSMVKIDAAGSAPAASNRFSVSSQNLRTRPSGGEYPSRSRLVSFSFVWLKIAHVSARMSHTCKRPSQHERTSLRPADVSGDQPTMKLIPTLLMASCLLSHTHLSSLCATSTDCRQPAVGHGSEKSQRLTTLEQISAVSSDARLSDL